MRLGIKDMEVMLCCDMKVCQNTAAIDLRGFILCLADPFSYRDTFDS